jgi:catechol 2,3-dioxygenase-like lactoylglutathione lyase family enzyme
VKTTLSHLQVNIDPANLPFYRELFAFLGWVLLWDQEEVLGVGAGNEASAWFVASKNGESNDYDGPGVNHIGIGAGSVADVDAAARYLADHNVPALFDTPRHRPEFASAPDQTYYQVMFESPDRVLFEVVYAGPK